MRLPSPAVPNVLPSQTTTATASVDRSPIVFAKSLLASVGDSSTLQSSSKATEIPPNEAEKKSRLESSIQELLNNKVSGLQPAPSISSSGALGGTAVDHQLGSPLKINADGTSLETVSASRLFSCLTTNQPPPAPCGMRAVALQLSTNSPFSSNLSCNTHLSFQTSSPVSSPQLVIRYLPSLLGTQPVQFLQNGPISPIHSLQVNSAPELVNNRLQMVTTGGGVRFIRPLTDSAPPPPLNTTLMIQQIRKPLTPPPPPASASPKPSVIHRPVNHPSSSQPIILQPMSMAEPVSSLPLSSSSSTGVKTVMKTTLVPRSSAYSESQINSILKGMVPEPPGSLASVLSSQDKEKAQAMAAVAVSNFEAAVAAADPLPQPLELPEAGPLPAAAVNDLNGLEDNVVLPELPENFVETLQQRTKEKSELRQVCLVILIVLCKKVVLPDLFFLEFYQIPLMQCK